MLIMLSNRSSDLIIKQVCTECWNGAVKSSERMFSSKKTSEPQRRSLREKFDQIASKLGIQTQEEWYTSLTNQLRSTTGIGNIGNYLMDENIKSYKEGLKIAYPEFEWDLLRFPSVPRGYYNNLDNLRAYLTHLGQQLGIKELDDWYKVRYNNIQDPRVFGAVTRKYGGSLTKTLMNAFPEHPWCIYRFAYVPTGHWDNEENHKKFLDFAIEQLQIKRKEDWARVTNAQLYELGGNSLLKRYHSIGNLVKKFYPELYLPPTQYKLQKALRYVLEELFTSNTTPTQLLRRFPRNSPSHLMSPTRGESTTAAPA